VVVENYLRLVMPTDDDLQIAGQPPLTPAQQVFERWPRPELGASASGRAVPTPNDEVAARAITGPMSLAGDYLRDYLLGNKRTVTLEPVDKNPFVVTLEPINHDPFAGP
jgi:hypothetical protein